MKSALEVARARLLNHFENALQAHVEALRWPATLVEPSRHVVFGGGKRVRPLLALLAAEAVGGSADDAMPWAMAVEMIHTYSLVHDDLPSMDDDDVRRGRPTCHVKYGEAMAILTGDALLTEAFAVLAGSHLPAGRVVALSRLLGRNAGGEGMVGGQVHDIGGKLDDLDALEHMQRLKTGALIEAAAEGGAIAAGAAEGEVAALRSYGGALGLLFQLTDDLIDREQDAESDGNSYLHHLDDEAVLTRRDSVAAQARESVQGLGRHAQPLLELVEHITHRDV